MATETVQTPKDDEPTIGKLVHDASQDISTLIRKEIQLAKSELKISAQFGVAGIVFFAAAAFIAVLAIIMLSVSIAYFINWAGLGLHWSFLIVFGLYLLLAGLLGYLGVKKVKNVGPPEKAIEQGREIPKNLKGKK
ncbi:MAG: hypothetical protein CMH83_11065 [Nocardioides sp.]|nr:hypothetical protein [Nocardioides sp.]